MVGKAFTLVELLVVIVILAIIAAVAIPKFANSTLSAKEAAIRRDLQVLREAASRFREDTGAYPVAAEHLASSTAPTRGLNEVGNSRAIPAQKYKGPYVVSVPVSPIRGNEYEIVVPTVQGKIVHHPAGRASDGSNYYNW